MNETTATSIDTGRLLLRPLLLSDLDWLTQLFSDDRVTEYLATGRLAGAAAESFAREFIDNSLLEFDSFGCGAMAILRHSDRQAIGYSGLRALPDRYNIAELIYAYRPDCWGQGYAQEVAAQLLAWGFRRFPEMAEIIAMARLENVASIAVMKKSGMLHRGRNEHYYGEPLEIYSSRRVEDL
jgi:ribosomal-protein-alanine N-acetyltransferase